MAEPRKRRAASSRERIPETPPPQPTPPSNGKPCAPTPIRSGYDLARTLQLCRLMLEDTEQFLMRYAPFLDDEIGKQASQICADIHRYMPRVNHSIAMLTLNQFAAQAVDSMEKGGGS